MIYTQSDIIKVFTMAGADGSTPTAGELTAALSNIIQKSCDIDATVANAQTAIASLAIPAPGANGNANSLIRVNSAGTAYEATFKIGDLPGSAVRYVMTVNTATNTIIFVEESALTTSDGTTTDSRLPTAPFTANAIMRANSGGTAFEASLILPDAGVVSSGDRILAVNPAGTEISYIAAPDSQDDRLPSTAPPAGALIKGNAAQTGYDASLILPDPVVGNENQLLSLNADRTSIAYIDAPSSNDPRFPSTAPPAGALIKGNAAQTGYDASLILPDPVAGNENQLLSLNADRTSIAYIDAPSSSDSRLPTLSAMTSDSGRILIANTTGTGFLLARITLPDTSSLTSSNVGNILEIQSVNIVNGVPDVVLRFAAATTGGTGGTGDTTSRLYTFTVVGNKLNIAEQAGTTVTADDTLDYVVAYDQITFGEGQGRLTLNYDSHFTLRSRKFGISADPLPWDATTAYESHVLVRYFNNEYISLRSVPAGNIPSMASGSPTDFWLLAASGGGATGTDDIFTADNQLITRINSTTAVLDTGITPGDLAQYILTVNDQGGLSYERPSSTSAFHGFEQIFTPVIRGGTVWSNTLEKGHVQMMAVDSLGNIFQHTIADVSPGNNRTLNGNTLTQATNVNQNAFVRRGGTYRSNIALAAGDRIARYNFDGTLIPTFVTANGEGHFFDSYGYFLRSNPTFSDSSSPSGRIIDYRIFHVFSSAGTTNYIGESEVYLYSDGTIYVGRSVATRFRADFAFGVDTFGFSTGPLVTLIMPSGVTVTEILNENIGGSACLFVRGSDGIIYGMGTNGFGELGVGSTTFVNRTFVPIPALPTDTMSVHSITVSTTVIESSYGFSVALTTSGGMYIAGSDFTSTFVRSNGLVNDELVRQVYVISLVNGRGITCLTNGNNFYVQGRESLIRALNTGIFISGSEIRFFGLGNAVTAGTLLPFTMPPGGFQGNVTHLAVCNLYLMLYTQYYIPVTGNPFFLAENNFHRATPIAFCTANHVYLLTGLGTGGPGRPTFPVEITGAIPNYVNFNGQFYGGLGERYVPIGNINGTVAELKFNYEAKNILALPITTAGIQPYPVVFVRYTDGRVQYYNVPRNLINEAATNQPMTCTNVEL